MRLPRFSIAELMAVVVLVAANCVALRAIPFHDSYTVSVIVLGGMTMADVLLVGLAIAIRQARRRGGWPPFWRGFEAAGALALVGYVALDAFDLLLPYMKASLVPLDFVIRHLGFESLYHGNLGPVGRALLFVFVTLVLAAPQVAIAAAGGWLARR